MPLMPDHDYNWLSDPTWRTRNDALFQKALKFLMNGVNLRISPITQGFKIDSRYHFSVN